MQNKIAFVLITSFFIAHFSVSQHRFGVSNLLEAQLGNLPQLDPKDQGSVYDRLDFSYQYKSLGAFTRVEQYYPTFESAESYTRLSQLKLQYSSKVLDVTLGNFYSSLGRGLLLRTYEIPSSIWETRGYRVRYGFYRDILGASVKLNVKNFELKVLGGEVLDVALPPTIDDRDMRRPDRIMGGELAYRFKKQAVGATFMRNEPQIETGSAETANRNYASLYYEGIVLKNFSLYGELAKGVGNGESVISFEEESAFGAYASINYAILNFGATLEYKNYNNFSIGTGVNDPPTLVKEHSYRLLNRSTHVPIITDESGYQLELYYNFENGSMLTFNTSMAKNEIDAMIQPVFREYFAEYQFYPTENIFAKVFADYAQDPFINEDDRFALGGSADFYHEKLTSTFDVEWQRIRRVTDTEDNFYNIYAAYTLTKASKYSASLVMEVTTDPIQIYNDKSYNIYPSVNLTYRPDSKNIISLFAGKRRGGPACNSGVCYDVLDFQGLELRVSSRFQN